MRDLEEAGSESRGGGGSSALLGPRPDEQPRDPSRPTSRAEIPSAEQEADARGRGRGRTRSWPATSAWAQETAAALTDQRSLRRRERRSAGRRGGAAPRRLGARTRREMPEVASAPDAIATSRLPPTDLDGHRPRRGPGGSPSRRGRRRPRRPQATRPAAPAPPRPRRRPCPWRSRRGRGRTRAAGASCPRRGPPRSRASARPGAAGHRRRVVARARRRTCGRSRAARIAGSSAGSKTPSVARAARSAVSTTSSSSGETATGRPADALSRESSLSGRNRESAASHEREEVLHDRRRGRVLRGQDDRHGGAHGPGSRDVRGRQA